MHVYESYALVLSMAHFANILSVRESCEIKSILCYIELVLLFGNSEVRLRFCTMVLVHTIFQSNKTEW